MYSSAHDPESRTRRSPEYKVRPWLRARIHPFCWGRSDRHKGNLWQTSKRQILNSFDRLRHNLPRSYLPKITNQLMMEHFVGSHILYFQSDGRTDTPETLICVDIDCHDCGTYEGACACIEWLTANGFPCLFWS